MGCSSSKQTICRNCQASISPTRRGRLSHPKTGDHDHPVTASPALGYLNLDPCHSRAVVIKPAPADHDNPSAAGEKFATGMIEAKTWSNMINRKIPKTGTPSGEPETINVWELMKDLNGEDVGPLRPTRHLRSFSFQAPPKPLISSSGDDHPAPTVKCIDEATLRESNSNSDETSIISDFDPELIDTFRKALEELPPASPFNIKTMTSDKKQKVIVYFTSLRGVRRTYEDCCQVLVTLKDLGVRVDERDLSMHSEFKEELRKLSGGIIELPMVYIGQEFIGGAEEIRRMDEEGKLKKLVEVCEELSDGGKCETCGNTRFLVCEECSGSCKIWVFGEEHIDEKEVKKGFHRCPGCNENGLIRCTVCCD